MCLGGGGQADYQPKYLQRTDPPPGPAAPPDAVNSIDIEPAKKKTTPEKTTTNRSSLNTGMY